jgi:hypothetical protein
MTGRPGRSDVPPPIHGRRSFREHIDPLRFPDEGMHPTRVK